MLFEFWPKLYFLHLLFPVKCNQRWLIHTFIYTHFNILIWYHGPLFFKLAHSFFVCKDHGPMTTHSSPITAKMHWKLKYAFVFWGFFRFIILFHKNCRTDTNVMGLTQLCWLSDLMSDTREKDFPNSVLNIFVYQNLFYKDYIV